MEDYYVHQQLDTTKKQGRLFELSLTSADDIQGSLQLFDIDDPPAYRAVSYVWGPPEPTDVIYIDSKPLRIRKNLHDFLLVYRSNPELQGTPVWIDQICIDQRSTTEKNHQVGLMGDIFSVAEMVYAWLGSQFEGGRSECFTRRDHDTPVRYASFQDLTDWNSRLWPALVTRPYWNRHWVIQEILLSRSCTIIYGLDLVALRDLIRAWRLNPKSSTNGRNILGSLAAVKATEDDSQVSLPKLMGFVDCDTYCEDPRDKVYALQSVVPLKHRVEVDYNKSVDEVFLDASSGYIEDTDHQETHSPTHITALALGMGLISKTNKDKMQRDIWRTRWNKSQVSMRLQLSEILSRYRIQDLPMNS